MVTGETTVYVVDDDAAVRGSLRLLLEIYGMRVEDFESPAAFVRAWRSGPRQCLVLDQHMPGITGLDFVASDDAPDLPVILLTGQGSAALKSRALASGAAAYLEKPVDIERLVGIIRSAVGGDSPLSLTS
jgi:FixJ family two-component response regulator